MTNGHLLPRAAALSAVAVAIAASCGSVSAQDRSPPAAASGPKCSVSTDIARFDIPLTRLALRLSGGLPIKIVAVGSSSTAGYGASSPARTYPSQLEAELRLHFPGHPITVINRGVNGEEAPDMLARFQTGVIAENPHLVVWQVGTNSMLRDRPLDPRATVLHEGIARLKASRTDIVLMDPQYAPYVLAKANRHAFIAQVAEAAVEEKVGLLRRYDIMRRWHETEGMPMDAFVTADGLHLNDWGYACLAKSLGMAIADAATRPTATAAAPTSTMPSRR